MSLLALDRFSVWRGHEQIVWEVSLSVAAGAVLALEGSNGAGKTTFLEGLAGLHTVTGEIRLGSRRLPPCGSAGRVAQGIGLSPDARRLFTDMTVLENLMLGAYTAGFAAGRKRAQAMSDAAPWLRDRWRQRAGTLSGGEQQLVAVCRALMSEPTLLLLDAATSGLAPAFRSQVTDLVRQFVARGDRAVVLADDDAEFVNGLASARVTMRNGRLEASSPDLGSGGPDVEPVSDRGVLP